MAGAKQHEMMFSLAAKQQASFSAAFSSARSEFQSLYQQAAALTQQQNDISAYQRQQSAVESTQNSLIRYQEKLENVRSALEKMGQTGEGTTQDTLRLQQQEAELAFKVSETSRKLTEQEEKLGSMGGKLEEAGVDTDNLSAEQERLASELSETKSKMDEIEGEGGFMDDAAASLESFASIATAIGAGKVLETLVKGMKECADAAADFEFGMSAVEAIANSSEDEIGALSDKALEIGANTMYTATEAADALSYMALAGWNSQEMLAGVDGVISLAAASGEDLASVSDIVTDALTAFGLSASDAGSFVDVLAAAATNSNTTVNMLGEAFKYAAPVAGALGYSVEDVSVAMGLMANNGIKGSMAGTTLRNVFNALTGDISLSSAAFGDVDISAVNADGSMMSLSDTIQMLRGYFDQMTESEKVQNAQNLAGQRAYAGLLAILNTTEDDYNSLASAIENSTGAAERMAEIRMDNTVGDLKLLESAFNGLQIAVGNNFTPVLSEMYEAGADVLNWMTDIASENPGLVSGIAATTTAVAGLTAAITAFGAAKKLASKIDLAALIPAGGALAAVAGVAAIVGTLAASIAHANKVSQEAHDAVYELTYASREQADEIENLTAQYDAMVDAGEGNSAQAVLLKNRIEDLTAEFESSKQSATDFYAEISDAAQSVSDSWSSYHDSMQGFEDEEASTMNLVARLQELSSQTQLTAGDEAEMAAIVDELNSRYSDLNLTLDDVTGKDPISLDTVAAMATAAAALAEFNEAYAQYGQMSIKQPGLDQAKTDALHQQIAAWQEWRAARDAATEATLNGNPPTQEEAEYVKQLYLNYQDACTAYEEATAAAQENQAGMADALSVIQNYTSAQQAANESMDESSAAYAEMQAALQALEAEYYAAYDAALASYQGQFGLFETAPEIVAASVDDMIAALDSQLTYWEDYASNLETLQANIESLGESGYDTTAIEEYVNAVNDGSAEGAALVAALATANGDDLAAIGDAYSAVQTAQEDTAAIAADMQTGFSAAVDQMAADMESGESEIDSSMSSMVSDMNKSGEASAAGQATAQAYVDAIYGMVAAASAAGAAVAAAASSAMSTSGVSVSGFATGTTNAPPGWAWVGEAGPELMKMRGGEQILNHEQSENLMQQMEESAAYADTAEQFEKYEAAQQPVEMDYSQTRDYTTVTVSPIINISGVGSQEDMQMISDELMARITDTVMDAIEDAGIDARRGALR